jgi:HK97 gp10 family phage protein
MAEVRIRGASDLKAFMESLPAKVEANVMRSAMRAGANVVAQEARARVPVNTGRLRESIRVTTGRKGGKVYATVKAGGQDTRKRVVTTGGGKLKVRYDNAYYAQWVEYGTAAHKIGVKYAKALALRPNKRASLGFAKRLMRSGILVEGVNHPGARPRPFLRPAIDTKYAQAVQTTAEAIRKRLQDKHGLDRPDTDGGDQ